MLFTVDMFLLSICFIYTGEHVRVTSLFTYAYIRYFNPASVDWQSQYPNSYVFFCLCLCLFVCCSVLIEVMVDTCTEITLYMYVP